MGRLMFGRGKARLVMDDVFDRLYRNAIERLAPGVLAKVEAARDRIGDGAIAGAPVKTGHFKSRFDRALVVSPDHMVIRASVYNFAKYARYVRLVKQGDKNAFVELLRKPLKLEAKRLLRELPADTVRALRGR
jgi:hypothetical protein